MQEKRKYPVWFLVADFFPVDTDTSTLNCFPASPLAGKDGCFGQETDNINAAG